MPGHVASTGSTGLIVSMVIRPRPTRRSTASRCGLASPSGMVDDPAVGFRTERYTGLLLGGRIGTAAW